MIWSGCWNLIGVLTSTGAVAFGILALLPVELVVNIGSADGFAMVFALLISAIMWNLGTWYLGLPASSSHTLIGSIMGVGLTNSFWLKGHVLGRRELAQGQEVFSSLLISPVVGFVCSALAPSVKALIRNPCCTPRRPRAPRRGFAACSFHLHRRELCPRIQRRPKRHGIDHADFDRDCAGGVCAESWAPIRRRSK